MKLVHASDLHVASPVRKLAPYEGAPEAVLQARQGASRRALERLVDLCIAERAALLVVAGDLFDAWDRNYEHALFFLNELVRLGTSGTRAVWVRGNHDAASGMLWHLPLPERANELGLHGPESLVLEELGIALHGVSYDRPEVTEDLSVGYPEPIAGFFNVGLLHTAAEGRIGHDSYAPCRVKALVQHGYDYWALGHPHTPEIAAWEPPVVFPGNLQGRSFRERGPRGAVLVEVSGTMAARVEHRTLDSLRFENVVVPANEAASLDDVHEAVHTALAHRVAANDETPLVVRLIVEGRSAAGALLAEPVGLRTSALRSAAREADGPGVYVDEAWALVREEPGGLFRVDGESRNDQ